MYEFMLLVSVLIFVTVAVAFFRTGCASIFHPLSYYLAFHGLIFVFRPILAWVRDYRLIYRVYQFMPSMQDRLTVLVAANVGLLCFAIACMRRGNVPMIFRDDLPRRLERKSMSKMLPYMMAICVPIGVYSLSSVVGVSVSGETTMVFTSNGYKVNTTGVGYLTDAMMLLVPICGMFAWFHRFRPYAWLPLLIFFVFKASTGGRGAFVLAAAATALFYFYEHKIRIPGVKLLLPIAALGLVFSAVGQDRGYALREALGFENKGAQQIGGKDRFLEGMDFANMEYFQYIVYVVPQRSQTYDYFLSNLQLFTEPVPRALWPGKPVGPPIQLIQFFDYGTPFGMSYSLPGVGWFEAGWAGVIIWCSLWGWLAGLYYRRFVMGPQDSFSVSFYMASLPILIIAFRDGTVLTVVRQAVFYVAPPLVMLLFARIFRLPKLATIIAAVRQQIARRSADPVEASSEVPMGRGRRNRLAAIAQLGPAG